MQARSAVRKSQILSAARRLLVERGYEKMTVEMVAKEAGAALGSVTHFFKTKEGIAAAVADEVVAAVALDAKAALRSGGDHVEQSTRYLVTAALAWPTKFPGYRELAVYASPVRPKTAASTRRGLQRQLERILADWVQPLLLQKQVVALSSAELFALLLAPAMTDVAAPVVRPPTRAMQDWAEVIVWAAMNAIKPAKRKTGVSPKPPKSGGLPDLFDHDLVEQRAPGRKDK